SSGATGMRSCCGTLRGRRTGILIRSRGAERPTMRIGLTYDLRDDYLKLGYDEQQVAEFDRADTIVALEKALRALGHKPVRVGRLQSLTERLGAGERWDLVFNIAEGLSSAGIAREAHVPSLLDLHGIPYTFSDPLVCTLTLHKAMCKLAV